MADHGRDILNKLPDLVRDHREQDDKQVKQHCQKENEHEIDRSFPAHVEAFEPFDDTIEEQCDEDGDKHRHEHLPEDAEQDEQYQQEEDEDDNLRIGEILIEPFTEEIFHINVSIL